MLFSFSGAFQRFSGLNQIKEAKEDTSSKGAFSIKLLEILCGTGTIVRELELVYKPLVPSIIKVHVLNNVLAIH